MLTSVGLEHIPVYVLIQFDSGFQRRFRRRKVQKAQKDALFCPSPRCGYWVRPKYIKLDTKTGREQAKCRKCELLICKKCNMEWHSAGECKIDESTQKVLELVKEKNFQQCPQCHEMVERMAGCNHMTCICGHQFCVLCGRNWLPKRDQDCIDKCPLINEEDRIPNPDPVFNPDGVHGDAVGE
jgi:IBR domain, a half RING-finger domain